MILPFLNNQPGSTTDSVLFNNFAKNVSNNISQINSFDLPIADELYSSGYFTVGQLPSATQQTTVTEDYYCKSPSFIDAQIPFWIKQNYSNSEQSYFVNFLTEYYNWLYCGFKKNNIQLTPYDVESLFDINTVPDAFLDYYISTYAPFIQNNSSLLKRENVRKFIKNIKTNFLVSKGTASSAAFLLKTLFGVTLENIGYPRRSIVRLNGGRFENDKTPGSSEKSIENQLAGRQDRSVGCQQGGCELVYWDNYGEVAGFTFFGFGTPDPIESLSSSPSVSANVFPDNNFWNDYSYFISTSLDSVQAEQYISTFLKAVHPAGFKAFFEEYIAPTPYDYGTFDDNTDLVVPDTVTFELPVIKNYLPYSPNYNLNSGGITFCNCCLNNCNPSGGAAVYPTHAEPRWSASISNSITYFGDITIGDFIRLYPAEVSPNPNIDDCTGC